MAKKVKVIKKNSQIELNPVLANNQNNIKNDGLQVIESFSEYVKNVKNSNNDIKVSASD